MELLANLLVPLTFVVMLVVERLFPARRLPRVRFWLFRGVFFFLVAGALNGFIPALLARAVGEHAPLHLARLGTVGGAVVGFFAGDLVSYGVHRLLHTVPALWRWTHQMHHSAERVDVAGGAYFHPFDITIQILGPSLVTVLLGLTPEAALVTGYVSFLTGMFPHMNVRTPQWLGWIIQRPEAHSVHHARGVHAYNYGTFMLWDIVLGTFRNPARFSEEAGFWDGASDRVGAMLVGRDVSAPPAGDAVPVPAE